MTDRRQHAERTAQTLFVGAALTMAIICGAVIVSGYFAGVIQDQYERVFWAGALLGGLSIAVLAAAAFPGGDDDVATVRRVTVLTRIGLLAFIIAPALCIGSLVADFYL